MAVPRIPGDPAGPDDAALGEAPAQAPATAPVMRILQVDDVARSVSFYRDVLGFARHEAGPDGSREAAAELVLGAARIQLVRRDQGMPPRPAVVFLQAADLGRVHAGIRARGGDPSEPARVNWIKYEVFEVRDPDGNAIWFGESFAQPYERSRGGMLEKALPELPCDDVAAAVAYYRDVLGFSVNYQQHDLGVMQRDDVAILLLPRVRAGSGGVEFYVRDADALYRELRDRGADAQGEPVSHPWGLRDFAVLDRDGNRLTFAQPFE